MSCLHLLSLFSLLVAPFKCFFTGNDDDDDDDISHVSVKQWSVVVTYLCTIIVVVVIT